MIQSNNSLGCGREFKMNTSSGFICGVPNGWGYERLCLDCEAKIRKRWKEEDIEKLKKRTNEINLAERYLNKNDLALKIKEEQK